jgi:hypothetical protein
MICGAVIISTPNIAGWAGVKLPLRENLIAIARKPRLTQA